MKRLLLFFALSVFTCVHAQKYNLTPKKMAKHERKVRKSMKRHNILWDYDTVFNAGVPYCIVYEVKHPGNPNYDYSVRSLSGQELIYVHFKETTFPPPFQTNPDAANSSIIGRYMYYFTDTKTTVRGPSLQQIYEEVVNYNLIENGNEINPAGEAAFIKRFGGKHGQHVEK